MLGNENDAKITIKVICITILCIVLGFVFMFEATQLATRYTPVDYVKEIWKKDSITITQNSPELASDYIMGLLRKNNNFENPKLEHAKFDENKKEYKVCVTHQKDIGEGKKGFVGETYWVKLDFNSNNGDYIVIPIITSRLKNKDYVKVTALNKTN